ncbi:MAG: YggS family pyridoxal phosphate-dependent enzyme [Deltaproteobacteria bacterium]|nr:YggS family pyridoxal phosphate-dependent enzyme [Deltaproteobacteria bacterium]
MKKRLENVMDRIHGAALAAGRNPESVRLVAVSKTIPEKRVREAIEAGVILLGENYVQEAREKIKVLSRHAVSWHMIGHLQTNKAKYAVRLFDLIQTVDSLKLARELDRQAQKVDKIQEILIQVNIGKDPAKSGAHAASTRNLIQDISRLDNLSIKGLMTMPPFFNSPEKVRPYFSALRRFRDHLKKEAPPNVSMAELSMGMTGDFEAAVEEGATLVRIGTALFGERT